MKRAVIELGNDDEHQLTFRITFRQSQRPPRLHKHVLVAITTQCNKKRRWRANIYQHFGSIFYSYVFGYFWLHEKNAIA